MDTAPAVKKRPTQGLHLCCAVDLEREMPASPCSPAHRGCSVSDKYDTMMPDTVAADSTIHTLPCIFQRSWCTMASGCVAEFKVISLEWKNTGEGCNRCRWMLQNRWSSSHRYASERTCTPINLRLWCECCLSFWCHCLREAELPWCCWRLHIGLRRLVSRLCTTSASRFLSCQRLKYIFCRSTGKRCTELERSLTLACVKNLFL